MDADNRLAVRLCGACGIGGRPIPAVCVFQRMAAGAGGTPAVCGACAGSTCQKTLSQFVGVKTGRFVNCPAGRFFTGRFCFGGAFAGAVVLVSPAAWAFKIALGGGNGCFGRYRAGQIRSHKRFCRLPKRADENGSQFFFLAAEY